jgi:ectoine hydroxylase-related dioxygenase (phytanoyl-CoA dioxygenase family)
MSELDEHFEALSRDGYCIVTRAFSDAYCDQATEALRRIAREHAIGPSNQDFSGRKTVRIMNLLQYDDLFQDIPVHDRVLPLVERYLDRECLLSGIDSSEIHPGETGQPIHTDTWWHDDRRFDFPVSVNTILALTDFTEENGATRLVPGSHLWTAEQVAYEVVDAGFAQVPGANPKGYGTDWTPIHAEAPKGSVIIYDSRLLHGAGANRSDRPRPSVISPYVLGWIRQLDNFAYGLSHEKARDLPPRLQRLIGLECYREHYAQVNNMSPREWLWGRKAHAPA